MRLLSLLAVLAFLLPACDSGGSTDSNDLVGTWRTQSITTDTYVTSSTAQTARDPLAAGTGSVVLSGAVTATLRFAPLRSAGTAITGGFLTETSTDRPLLNQAVIQFAADGTPGVFDPPTFFPLVPVAGTAPYTFSATAIEFSGTTFRAGGSTVTATGRIAFVQRPLAAGRESLASRQPAAPADFGTASITFEADGGYRVLGPSGAQTGTWVTSGDGAITLTTATASNTFSYEISGSELTLTLSQPGVSAADLRNFEPLLGVTPGSLTAARSESVLVFGRAAE